MPLGIVELSFLLLLCLLLVWTMYNLPVLAKGVAVIRHQEPSAKTILQGNLPSFSIIIAAKSEEKVIGRLLDSLLKLDYPKEKTQIIIVEDGSNDRTCNICESYAQKHPSIIEFHHRDLSENKPAALNYGLRKANGDIIAILDADNIPEKDLLLRAARAFENSEAAAIQGQTCPINLQENFLTRLEAYNQDSWFKIYLQGKTSLRLFVPLTGSCGFIKRNLLLESGGWDEKSLTEDVELAAKLAARNHRIIYAPEIRSWQENASSLHQVIKQRRRWFRGYMETLAKYATLFTRSSRIGLDVEITLMGPMIVGICFLTNTIGIYGLISHNLQVGWELTLISTATGFLTLATLMVCSAGLFYQSEKKRWRNLLWIAPLIAYWGLQMIIAFYTTLCFLLRIPQSWEKTKKTGSSDTQNQED